MRIGTVVQNIDQAALGVVWTVLAVILFSGFILTGTDTEEK